MEYEAIYGLVYIGEEALLRKRLYTTKISTMVVTRLMGLNFKVVVQPGKR